MEFEAARLRRLDEADRDTVLAWTGVYIDVATQSKKRMPDLTAMLPSKRSQKGRAQTPTEMRAALYQIAGQYGLTIRTKES